MATAQRAIRPSDIYRLKSVSDPQVSPDANGWRMFCQHPIRQRINRMQTFG